MSEPLNSFIVRVGKPLQAADYDGSSAFLNDTSQSTETTFLMNQTEAPESFLSLSEPSVTPTVSSGIEVGDGEHVLLSGNGGVVEDEVTTGPLLYLDPSSGLHVLVHSLCQTFQHSNTSQDGGITPEQFVVVGALQTDEEPMVLERSIESLDSKSSNIATPSSVDNILNTPMISIGSTGRDDPAVHQIFPSTVEPTLDLGIGIPSSQNYVCTDGSFKESAASLVAVNGAVTSIDGEKLQHKDSSQIHCSDTPVLKLQVTDERHTVNSGELQRDILMEAVPHINLEEIIEKFTSENTSQMIKYDKSESTVSEKENEYSTSIESVSVHPGEELPSEKRFSVLLDDNLKTPLRSNSTVKLKITSDIEESVDEDSLYDIVMTYKCKVCSEVFLKKAQLIEHYKDIHKPRKGVKICFTSKNSTPLETLPTSPNSNIVKKVTVSTLSSGTSSRKTGDSSHLTCKHCFRIFSDEKEYRQHIVQVHNNSEAGKKTKRGSRRGLNGLTAHPGILISHREERLQNQADSDGGKTDSNESQSSGQKRRLKAPEELQQQFLLQKQRPRPVVTKEVKKLFKCSVTSCRYKFSTKEKVHDHEQYHRYCGSSKENYFTCIHCSEKFKKWSFCQFHVWKAHGIDIDLLTCGICQVYKTNTEQKLVLHQKIHSDTRDYICKVCGKAFHQPAQLLNHEVIHVSDPKDRPQCHQGGFCSECDRWFGDQRALKRHIDSVHLKVKPNKCPHCPYKCVRVFDLMLHMRRHTGEKPYKCELCGHNYRDSNTFRRHKRIHFLIKPFKCPYEHCQFEGCSSSRFRKHMAKTHPGIEFCYKCQVCSMETQDVQEYTNHYSIHEEQLFREAFEKRTGNPLVSSVTHSAGKDLTSDAKSNVIDEKNKGNAKVKLDTDKGNPIEKVHSEENERKDTFSNITPQSFVFESVEGDGDVTMQNSQIYTIKVEDLEPTESTLVKIESPSTAIRSDSDVHKSANHEQSRLEDILKTHVLNPTHQGSSVLGVAQKSSTVLQKIMEPPSHETAVLSVVDSSTSAPVLEVEDQTLMTFSQVISEDGQQYIIGISPEDISPNNIADQTDIFTIEQDEQ